ncbi:MAG: type II toxin-antitoxin system RelE/ParE family toxin [Defluviitaleaceae bacterium]|nr:type II toxin-antitoxin system RelE/ParE family toxin [Defluviitaleaceae bacterium]
MKTYKIEFRRQADRFISSRPIKERIKLLAEIYKLPYSKHVKKMEGYKDRYRLRVGDFRVIYEKLDQVLIILVLEVGNRGDVYK